MHIYKNGVPLTTIRMVQGGPKDGGLVQITTPGVTLSSNQFIPWAGDKKSESKHVCTLFDLSKEAIIFLETHCSLLSNPIVLQCN